MKMMITNILIDNLFLIYLIVINFITFIVFALDKLFAIKKKWRYKVVTLLGLCFIGGALGGFFAMHLFRHKTKKKIFVIGVPLMLIIQIMILLFIK